MMNRSLYTKLVLIMMLLIVSLMTVVGAFLMRGIRNFYLNEFYLQMQTAFSNVELVDDLRSASDAYDMARRLGAYSGLLGIDSGTRNYYILSGDTASHITGSDGEGGASLEITPNILTALTGAAGSGSDSSADYMDVALPLSGDTGDYIVYIKDNRHTVQSLSDELFKIILSSLLVGLVISAMLSLVLAKTMVTPIQSLTAAAERVADGDFSSKPDNEAKDEIGVLTQTFNNMASQLESTLDDLKRSESMRREFVANVSHELRTPITNIRSYAETLEDAQELPRQTERNFLKVIVNESDRMAKIVQDLLTLSKFDAGNYEFQFESFSFRQSVQDVFNAMMLEAQRYNHHYRLEIKNELPVIIGDKPRLEQVLINMLSNAIKYTPDGGDISLSAGSAGKGVWAAVRDNGVGIRQEDLGRVFDRFYRVDKARSRESGGTGLGLAIAQEIVHSHEGTIDIQSKPGRGTLITITLPVEGPSDVQVS